LVVQIFFVSINVGMMIWNEWVVYLICFRMDANYQSVRTSTKSGFLSFVFPVKCLKHSRPYGDSRSKALTRSVGSRSRSCLEKLPS
jgi:hypothetical protein